MCFLKTALENYNLSNQNFSRKTSLARISYIIIIHGKFFARNILTERNQIMRIYELIQNLFQVDLPLTEKLSNKKAKLLGFF
jgi:hypothetical protein